MLRLFPSLFNKGTRLFSDCPPVCSAVLCVYLETLHDNMVKSHIIAGQDPGKPAQRRRITPCPGKPDQWWVEHMVFHQNTKKRRCTAQPRQLPHTSHTCSSGILLLLIADRFGIFPVKLPGKYKVHTAEQEMLPPVGQTASDHHRAAFNIRPDRRAVEKDAAVG